jgi:nicotinate phosphoribosyltransferase
MKPIVRGLLENRLDKFTMCQALLHRHADSRIEYFYLCRNTPAHPIAELKADADRIMTGFGIGTNQNYFRSLARSD